MSSHSVAEARNNLSELIARAVRGEEVVITRHGQPVVELKSVEPARTKPRRMTQADLDWLDENRIQPGPDYPGAAALVRQMRDEGH